MKSVHSYGTSLPINHFALMLIRQNFSPVCSDSSLMAPCLQKHALEHVWEWIASPLHIWIAAGQIPLHLSFVLRCQNNFSMNQRLTFRATKASKPTPTPLPMIPATTSTPPFRVVKKLSAIYRSQVQGRKTRLRDPESCLPLSTDASSRNQAFNF